MALVGSTSRCCAAGWRLRLPYADPRELLMDILRHVPEVAVIGPVGLREAVEEKLRVALGRVTP